MLMQSHRQDLSMQTVTHRHTDLCARLCMRLCMPSPTSVQMCTIVSVRGPICIRPGTMSIHAHRPRDGTCCEPHGGLRPAHRYTPIHRYVDGDADGRVDEQANSDARGLSAGIMGHRLSVRGGRVYTKSRSQTRLKLGNAGRSGRTRGRAST